MDVKQLHIQNHIRRHTALPHLWRARCSCGEWFLAASEEMARLALHQHIEAEEPFPDMSIIADGKETKAR